MGFFSTPPPLPAVLSHMALFRMVERIQADQMLTKSGFVTSSVSQCSFGFVSNSLLDIAFIGRFVGFLRFKVQHFMSTPTISSR